MPIVRIDITGPKSAEWKRAVLNGVRRALTETLDIPDSRASLRIYETPDDCLDVPDCRTDRFTMIEVIMYEGRTEEQKHAFMRAVRERLAQDPGIEPSEVAVLIRDSSKVDLDVPPGEAGTT